MVSNMSTEENVNTNDTIFFNITNNLNNYNNKNNIINNLTFVNIQKNSNSWLSSGRVQIPFYTIILLLAIVGNVLVISTLVQNRRMRTITNLFLLNLAVSDILLGVLCMPFTLIGALLRDFVFGEFMCKLLPFLQATSVAVSSWTLVAISCERYYAICHPLRSRRWQTLRHAYKLIAFIWIGSLICMSPIAGLSRLIPTSQGHRKCREHWPEEALVYERGFNLFLDLILLVLPLFVLCGAYFLITRTLWHGIRTENNTKNHVTFSMEGQMNQLDRKPDIRESENQLVEVYLNSKGTPCCRSPSNETDCSYGSRRKSKLSPNPLKRQFDSTLRRTNVEKNLQNKQRVIKMLFVLVLEFFICWTPLYVINTIALFNPALVYTHLGYTGISFFQLLAYSSSCCNPITYCFMNPSFRKAFLDTFRGIRRRNRCSLKTTRERDVDSFKITISRT